MLGNRIAGARQKNPSCSKQESHGGFSVFVRFISSPTRAKALFFRVVLRSEGPAASARVFALISVVTPSALTASAKLLRGKLISFFALVRVAEARKNGSLGDAASLLESSGQYKLAPRRPEV